MQHPTNMYEDEINLIDLFMVIWKRKWFVVLLSIIPPLIIGLFLFLSPRNYKVTYSYDTRANGWDLNKTNYIILLNSFFSSENQKKIVTLFHKTELDNLAESIINSRDGMKKIIEFEVLPPYPDISKLKNLNAEKIKKLQSMNASLLKFTITGKSEKDINKIFSIIKTNFESEIPLYRIINDLDSSVNHYRYKMTEIDKLRFGLKLELKSKSIILKNLKKIKSQTPKKDETDILLQFDVGNKSEYLPIHYQIEAVESKIIKLEQNINNNAIMYDHYNSLLNLNNTFLAEVEKKISTAYTIQQFHSFLLNVLKETQKEEIKDYLNAYIKDIENCISSCTPLSSTPRIIPVSKGTLKISAIVFVLSIMIALFTAFLLEGFKKRNEKIKG